MQIAAWQRCNLHRIALRFASDSAAICCLKRCKTQRCNLQRCKKHLAALYVGDVRKTVNFIHRDLIPVLIEAGLSVGERLAVVVALSYPVLDGYPEDDYYVEWSTIGCANMIGVNRGCVARAKKKLADEHLGRRVVQGHPGTSEVWDLTGLYQEVRRT